MPEMTQRLRFALVGKSGSGKSEAAKILQGLTGCRIVKTGAVCRQISHMLFGNEDKASTQLLDDALTPIDPSIFLRASLRDLADSERIVIDSLRFASDYALARTLGCAIIRVEASEDDRVARLGRRGQQFDPLQNGSHRSETELDTFATDHILVNNGTLDDLLAHASTIAGSALK